MATNPKTFIALGMPSALANAVSAAIDAAAGGGGVSWSDVTDKPATFPPVIGNTASTAMAGNATPTPGDNSVTDAKVAANAAIGLAKLANTAAITTAGGTTIPAGTLQATLQAIADESGGEVTWAEIEGKPATFPPVIGNTATTAMAGNTPIPTIPEALPPTDGSVTNVKVAAGAAIDLNKLANVAAITTEGGTTIPAGNIQATLQAIADLADPAG